jgi:hypothetical protein
MREAGDENAVPSDARVVRVGIEALLQQRVVRRVVVELAVVTGPGENEHSLGCEGGRGRPPLSGVEQACPVAPEVVLNGQELPEQDQQNADTRNPWTKPAVLGCLWFWRLGLGGHGES